MSIENFVTERVGLCYREKRLNCAGASLYVTADFFGFAVQEPLLHATIGMNGAGRYGAQCGLVEGGLMFIGIFGHQMNLKKSRIVNYCHDFAHQFEKNFGSLLCRELRPTGFQTSDPPHMCEPFTCKAVCHCIAFMQQMAAAHGTNEHR